MKKIRILLIFSFIFISTSLYCQISNFEQPKAYEVIGYLTQVGSSDTRTIVVLTIERARTWQNYYDLDIEPQIQKLERDFFYDRLIPIFESAKIGFKFVVDKPEDYAQTKRIFELRLISTGQYDNYRKPGVVGADFERFYQVTLIDFVNPKNPKRLTSGDALYGRGLGWYLGKLLIDNMVTLSPDSMQTLNLYNKGMNR